MPTSNTEPPLITVTNPVTYLRLWWQKVMGKEGIDLSFKIHPITAVLMVAVVATIGFGAGRISVPEGIKIPFFSFGDVSSPKPLPTKVPDWRETAFSGKLQYSMATQKYFLVTTSAEAITLEVPSNIDLSSLIGRRIMAIGEYDKSSKILRVLDTKDLEILPKSPQPVPTIVPSSTPTASAYPSPTEIPMDSPLSDN